MNETVLSGIDTIRSSSSLALTLATDIAQQCVSSRTSVAAVLTGCKGRQRVCSAVELAEFHQAASAQVCRFDRQGADGIGGQVSVVVLQSKLRIAAAIGAECAAKERQLRSGRPSAHTWRRCVFRGCEGSPRGVWRRSALGGVLRRRLVFGVRLRQVLQLTDIVRIARPQFATETRQPKRPFVRSLRVEPVGEPVEQSFPDPEFVGVAVAT